MIKVFPLIISLLLIGTPIVSSVEAGNDSDLDVKIFAGLFGLDIGRGIRGEIINNRNETIYFNIM